MPEPKLTKSAKALLEYFRTFPAGEPITATHKELATALNCNEKTIKRGLNQIKEIGEIRIESGKEDCKANTYFLNDTLRTNVLSATFVSKDFTPKANAVLKNYIPLRQEEENRPESGISANETTKSGNYPIAVESKTDGKNGKEDNSKSSVIQKIPQLKSKLPESHIMPINRLANELQHDIANIGAFDLVVAGKNTSNEITNYTCVTFDSTDGIKMAGKPYTEYDRQVHDTVCSLWEYGHKDKTLLKCYSGQ